MTTSSERVRRLLADLEIADGAVLDVGDVLVDLDAELATRRLTRVAVAPDEFLARTEDVVPDGCVAIAVGDAVAHREHPDRIAEVLAHLVAGRRPVLLLSLGNPTHVAAIGASLLGGAAPTSEPVPPTTALGVLAALRRAGFAEVGTADVVRPFAEAIRSRWPVPAAAPVADLLRTLRALPDDLGHTERFCRTFVHTGGRPPEHAEVLAQPALTVLLRTQGTRATLRDTLLSLAAQSTDDFEVLLLVHSDSDSALHEVRSTVSSFAPEFGERVKVVHVEGGGRSRPLNVGLDLAAGRLVAFLDDDDLVFSNWVSTFVDHNDGRVVRARTADREVCWAGPGELGSWRVLSRLGDRWVRAFDLIDHLADNHTPICSWAVPTEVVRTFRLRFDERLQRVEDWDLLLRCVLLLGVHDVDVVTSVYQRWQHGEQSSADHPPELWQASYHAVLEQLDASPLLLPRGTASALARLRREVHAGRELAASVDGALHAAGAASLTQVVEELQRARDRVEALERSSYWRLTRPIDKAVRAARSAAGRRNGTHGPPADAS